MDITQADAHSRFKLAQLWHIVNGTNPLSRKAYLHNRIVNEILKDEFNVNYRVTVNFDTFRGMFGYDSHLNDCTALHFLHYPTNDIHAFTKLIKRGADFTIKNGNGQTVLHRMITGCTTQLQRETPFINLVLSAHVKFQNSTNPRDNNGFSHLHAACIFNHVEAVQLFLDNGASVNEAVNHGALKSAKNTASALFAGYTALHFAVHFFSIEVAQILLNRGADINAQTADGASPIDILIEKEVIYITSNETSLLRDQMIKLLLENDAVSAVGFSKLQIACTLKDFSMAERLLEEGADIEYVVPKKSRSENSGCTALHFAVDNSLEAVELLLKRGAKLNVANAQELTPLDFFIGNYSLQDLCKIMLYVPNWKGIRLSDGQTVLLDLIAAMSDLSQFKLFLENEIKDFSAAVPIDSKLWPGSTILHLAVIFSKRIEYDNELPAQGYNKVIVEECLKRGLNLDVQDVRGRSPIHEAFRRGKNSIVELFLQRLDESTELVNLVDEDNLSYLHIACAMKDESVAGKLMIIGDPNSAYKGKNIPGKLFAPGSTALHTVAANGSGTIADMLLRQGADLHAKDANGFTPIHWLLNFQAFGEHQGSGNTLFTALLADPQDRVVEGYSYLHVACHEGHFEAVEKLVDLGSDVNAVIEADESSASGTLAYLKSLYSNVTPLQIATKILGANEAILNLLIRRGADVFIKQKSPDSKCVMPRLSSDCPLENKIVLRCFFQALWDQDESQKNVAEKLGLSKLHIACYLKNEEAIRTALVEAPDVNVQVPADTVLFAGCTPLHLLMSITDSQIVSNFGLRPPFTVSNMINLLVDLGADVTMANVKNETPIHVFIKNKRIFRDGARCTSLLLNAHQDFSVNPSNADGFTHFHLASLSRHIQIVNKFLQHGSVNVNQPIDYCAKHFAGCTPLHLALNSQIVQPNNNDNNNGGSTLLQLVDLLLRHGADVRVKDVAGDTPLHKPAALISPESSIMDILVSYGADVNNRNIRGQTPIENLMDVNGFNANANRSECLKILKKYNHKINNWNYFTDEGYIAKLFSSAAEDLSDRSEFKEFLQSSDAKTIDDSGRTAIHNAVAASENHLLPGNIQNYNYAVQSLTDLGINVNHQDNSGQTALHYAVRFENTSAVEALLASGADVNIVDNSGKSAFSYATENSKDKYLLTDYGKPNVTVVLRLYIKKLQHLKIEVSQLNQDLVTGLQNQFEEQTSYTPRRARHIDPKNLSPEFFSQVELTTTLDIGTNSLTLFNFLSEAGALTLYPLLLESERQIVNNFFQSIDYSQLGELAGIVKLQYKKMSARLGLIDPALRSLRKLLGFSIPGLSEQISRYLPYSDLKNLIESTKLKAQKRKISDISS